MQIERELKVKEAVKRQYQYFDKVITYVSLIHQAKEMGNGDLQDNFLVQDAKAQMEENEKNL